MYKLNTEGGVVRLVDGSSVHTGTPEYEAFIAWTKAGNKPAPADGQVDPNDVILAEIAKIERDTMVPRVMREFLITMAEREAQREVEALAEIGTIVTAEQLLSQNSGYVKAKVMDDYISNLRARLK